MSMILSHRRNLLRLAFPLITFLASLATYWATVDPGPSYWDCPEYLITALRLEVGHPPGNPGWALTHRVATALFSSPETQTLAVNLMSGLFTALATMLLCIVGMSAMRLIWNPTRHTRWRRLAIGFTSCAGALCFAWSDSAWYSAVEAEVYAMSLFLSALTVWMALKWAFSFSRAARMRWLVAIAYIIGFSLGVHQLNLLALPAIALVMAAAARSWKSHLVLRRSAAFAAACIAVVVILKGIMPGAVALASRADVFCVNSLGWPYWAGAIAAWSLALAVVVALAIAVCRRHPKSGTALWCLAAVMTGYCIYILIPLRAWANPPVNEGDPSSPGRLIDYLDRRQYGGAPLFYGRTPYSRIMRLERMSVSESGDTAYDYSWNALKVVGRDLRPMVRGGHIPERSRFLSDADRRLNRRLAADSAARGYAVTGFRTEPIYTPELNMLLPRIHSSSPADMPAYRDWTGMDSSNMVSVLISEAIDSTGRPVPMRDAAGNPMRRHELRPSYLQSLSYLMGYQTGYMYLRYLMWNFSGRQNDVPASGEIDHGNFITGLPLADDLMLGPQSALPAEIGRDNEGYNRYWAIPFLLGILGLVWLFAGNGPALSRPAMRATAWTSLVLMLMTGVAIVGYLNQTPGEPRERDYTFLMSYWSFALWIAMGMLLLLFAARRRWMRIAAMVVSAAVPLWMLAQNWGDHDRSHRSATLDYAANLLESLDKDAIIFVDGDNYIFPLWYAQEVMGMRPDVSVVCNSFLSCDWYLPQLMTPGPGNDGVAMTADVADVAMGNYNVVRMPGAVSDTLDAVEALRNIYADMSPTPQFSHRRLSMGSGDSRWVFDLLSMPGKSANSIASLKEVAMIDIIATNAASRYPRPVYWQQDLPRNKYLGFFPFSRQALFARRLMPEAPDSIILTDEALRALPALRWGGTDRMPYPGPDVIAQAQLQRASLIRLAEAMARGQRHDQALHIARMAMVRFPENVIPFGIRNHCDSAYFEARHLAALLIAGGEALRDTAAISEGNRLLRDDSIRTAAYRRYRQAIPPHRRGAISPKTNNQTILPK